MAAERSGYSVGSLSRDEDLSRGPGCESSSLSVVVVLVIANQELSNA